MPKDELTFHKVASPAPKAGLAGVWSAPQVVLDSGGNLAVWAEQGLAQPLANRARQFPWLVLHGGPGGSLGASHVAPIRYAGLPWFGFDQRNSGLSEDLDLSVIDLQRFVDDALEVADRLNIPKFHILGGSWGGTLALAIAAYRPEQVASVVLRAPFCPCVRVWMLFLSCWSDLPLIILQNTSDPEPEPILFANALRSPRPSTFWNYRWPGTNWRPLC